MDKVQTVQKVVTNTGVTVDEIYKSEFQKEGTKTAQLRQVIKTKSFYPSKQISNSHQDNPFDVEDFGEGFEMQEFENLDNRVTWIDIPEIISNIDDVLAKLPKDCCIYKILSNKPIITDSQLFAVNNPEVDLSMEDVANKQVVRFGKDHEQAGQIIKDSNGKVQYRANFFSKVSKEDIDLRNEDPNSMYTTEQIQAELSGAEVINNQDL